MWSSLLALVGFFNRFFFHFVFWSSMPDVVHSMCLGFFGFFYKSTLKIECFKNHFLFWFWLGRFFWNFLTCKVNFGVFFKIENFFSVGKLHYNLLWDLFFFLKIKFDFLWRLLKLKMIESIQAQFAEFFWVEIVRKSDSLQVWLENKS